MSHESCEAALQTVLAGVAGFSADTVVLADFGILSRGPDQLMVLTYAGFDQEDVAGQGDRFITWRETIHLYVRYVDNVQVHALARTTRQGIIDRLNAYYRLNSASNVFRADVFSGSTPGLGEPPGALANIQVGAVKYYHETFNVEMVEESDFAYVG